MADSKTTEVEVEQTSVFDQDKNGEQLTTKNGNRFWKAGIKTTDEDGEERWINSLIFTNEHPIFDVQEGDKVQIEVTYDNKWGLQFLSDPGEFEVLEKGDGPSELEKQAMTTEEAEEDEDLDVDEIPF